MDKYREFLETKKNLPDISGFDVEMTNQLAFDWQKKISEWACKQGRAALFEDCGLGKTPQELMIAEAVAKETDKPVLILAPLAVAQQTHREGVKFGIPVNVAEMQADIKKGINITNYEKLQKFDTSVFGGVILDESSILKSYLGKTKRMLVESFRHTPYKFAATATPAPNDLMELLNHAEFLGVMRSSEALGMWFIADQSQSGKYRLKGHAEQDFWQWVSSWAVCIEKPSDIGYSDEGYILPKLNEIDEIIPVSELSEDFTQGMFRNIETSATGFYKEKRMTLLERANRCAEIVNNSTEQFVVWCDTNGEADALKRLIPDSIEVRGSDKPETKEMAGIKFVNGEYRVLISKPTIFGYGLNFQNCFNTVFCGLTYSYENYYQAVRRFYRFGQTKPVNVYRVIGSTELHILDTINRKQGVKNEMADSMAKAMKNYQTNAINGRAFKLDLTENEYKMPTWLKQEVL